MKYKLVFIALALLFPLSSLSKTRNVPQLQWQQSLRESGINLAPQTSKLDDDQVAQLAVSSVAQIVQDMLNISQDPDNTAIVTENVGNIVATFANLVFQAMKAGNLELLASEEFNMYLRASVMKTIREKRREQ